MTPDFYFGDESACLLAVVLSLDATDMSGEKSGDSGHAANGEIHKVRLNQEGQRIGLGEYIPPRRWGFMMGKPRQVCALPLAAWCSSGQIDMHRLHAWLQDVPGVD